jgi:hypothetical protein
MSLSGALQGTEEAVLSNDMSPALKLIESLFVECDDRRGPCVDYFIARSVVSDRKARRMDGALVLSDEVSIRVEELLIIRSVEAVTVNADRI